MTKNKKMINLDQLSAEFSQNMVSKAKKVDVLERLVTKSLGVLQSQGVYALVLFLSSRSGEENDEGQNIRTRLLELLKKIPSINTEIQKWQVEYKPTKKLEKETNFQAISKFYSKKILNNLTLLLLVRNLYEQTLVYARFSAKSAKKNKGA